MTPKEKALDITDRYKPHVTTWDCYWDTHRNEEYILIDAKKCALICVDELIESWNTDLYTDCGASRYWQEVKQEIEIL